jgi:hypothetical protein
VAYSIVPLGGSHTPAPDAPPVEHVDAEYEPPSRAEVDYPIMREMHEASSLLTPTEVAAWREDRIESTPDAERAATERILVRPYDEQTRPADPLENVVLRRGSTRRFARGAAWKSDELATALLQATRLIETDFSAGDVMLNDLYLIVHAVDGLAPGAYRFEAPGGFELLRAGSFRREAGYLALEQELGARAAAVVFFLADLERVPATLGGRGYRAVQLEGGIRTGRVYLGAVAARLAATASTFYDDEVTAFFAPGTAKTPLLCAAVGRRR